MSFFLLQISYFLTKWFITSALLLTSSSISTSCLHTTAEQWGSSWSGESVSAWCLGWVWTCCSGASSELENRGLAMYRCGTRGGQGAGLLCMSTRMMQQKNMWVRIINHQAAKHHCCFEYMSCSFNIVEPLQHQNNSTHRNDESWLITVFWNYGFGSGSVVLLLDWTVSVMYLKQHWLLLFQQLDLVVACSLTWCFLLDRFDSRLLFSCTNRISSILYQKFLRE